MAHVKKEFDRLIAAQINISRSTFTKERINQHIARYEYANTNTGIKDKREYELLSRYDVVEVEGNKRLIKKGSNPYRFYCNTDELYELLKMAHIECNHGGEKKIMRLLSQKYANITMNQIKIFKSVCDVCKAKKFKKEDTTDKWISTISERFGNRGQVNTIDFQRQSHKGYSYILYYYDHETKFNSLRPLHSTEAAEIAIQLLDVFTIFGAPRILHSNNGKQFVRRVINELCTLWPELLIVEGRNSKNETVNEANVVVEDAVRKWTLKHPHTGWPDSLKFIQLALNSKFNESVLTSPFKALFNQDPIIGLNDDIPLSILNTTRLDTEEDLDGILMSYSNQEELSEGESIENPGKIKIEETYPEDMTENEFSVLDTLPNPQTIPFSIENMGPQLQCKICREYIMANVQTCVKCNNQIHGSCTQLVLDLSGKEPSILCKWCIEDTLPNNNRVMKNKVKRKGEKNRDLESKKTKNIMGYEELCPMIFVDQIKSEMQLPEMLSTFDTDDQLFTNDPMSSLLAQEMSSSQFELNDIFDSKPV